MACCTGPSDVCTLWEAITASPLVLCVSPVSMRNVVVLPAPLTPSNPKHWERHSIQWQGLAAFCLVDIFSETAFREEQNDTNFSFAAPSSEEL